MKQLNLFLKSPTDLDQAHDSKRNKRHKRRTKHPPRKRQLDNQTTFLELEPETKPCTPEAEC